MIKLKHFILLTLLFSLSSCATESLLLTESAEKDYRKAERLIANKDYGRAALYLGKFSTKYPYSQFATPADLLRFKSAYLNEEYILSETLSQRFINAHPEHAERDYAEYILGMSFFHQSESAHHEQVFSKKARDSFIALNTRNPSNEHASEVNEKLQIIINRIAEHEMIIGKFYYDSDLFVGAVNRFVIVKNEYLESNVAAESLYWLASSYTALQQHEYAQEVIQKLEKNFSDTVWHKKAEKL